MPTSADVVLLDTSAALALVNDGHVFHTAVYAEAVARRRGLAGHAAFETYSVLTRQPPPWRLPPEDARRLLEHNFPHTHHLSAAAAAELARQLPARGISGGAVYDALVAAAAREAGLPLLSCDVRAAGTYVALGVDLRLVTD